MIHKQRIWKIVNKGQNLIHCFNTFRNGRVEKNGTLNKKGNI